jgi:23S rRNA (adenine2030-N6)-methyltransferase
LSDYSHRFHAANHGDVFKHAVLVAALAEATQGDRPPLTFVETHSGEGQYRLANTGEWTEGIARLDAVASERISAGLAEFRAALARAGAATRVPNRGGDYPGSPRLALGALRPQDTAALFEKDAQAAAALTRALGHDKRARITHGDGWVGLAALAETTQEPSRRLFAHIDPPYTDKDEWTQAATALQTLRARRPDARAILWYPIKSLTRPNALMADLRRLGVPGVAVELHVTPQEIKRNALHGSGVLLVGASTALVERASALAAALGPLMATHDARWFTRSVGWGVSAASR